MPYIKGEDREKYRYILSQFGNIKDPGELNYVITMLVQLYLANTEKRYKDYNEVMGVLECAKQEFYRREISDYESKKAKENGDVYSD